MALEPTIFRDDEVVRAGSWNGVLFEVWRGTATAEIIREFCQLEIDYAKKQPSRKFALFSVVRVPSYSDFGAPARKELETRMQKIDPFMAASVVLLPTQSFGASIVRGIITGLALLARSKVPSTVTASPDEGCAWLAPHLASAKPGEPIAAADVRRALGVVLGA
jgi:hypothetical protein